MPLDFQVQSLTFPSVTGTTQSGSVSFTFPTAIKQTLINDVPVPHAWACLAGFDVKFSHEEDRHFGRLRLQVVRLKSADNVLLATLQYLLRDFSGNIDDPYEGRVAVLAIVDRL